MVIAFQSKNSRDIRIFNLDSITEIKCDFKLKTVSVMKGKTVLACYKYDDSYFLTQIFREIKNAFKYERYE